MKNIALLFLTIFILQGCSKDFFSTVVQVDLPEHESQLAVAAHFTNQDSILQVFVSNSLGIVDTQSYDEITDAEVRLLKDGVAVGTFIYSSESRYYELLNTGIVTEEVARYELQVEAFNYESVTAIQTMPSAPELIKIEFEEDAGINDFGERTDLFSIALQDNGAEENFYEFQANFVQIKDSEEIDRLVFKPRISIEPSDLVANAAYNGGIIFTDASFDGKETTIRANTYSYLPLDLEEFYESYAQLRNITPDRYYYLNSLEKSLQATENPFVEPVIVHENVENGHGVFTLSNSVQVKIE